MTHLDRRALMQLGLGAGAIAALPPSIAHALSLPAAVNSGTINDVEHVVILMQENRSFDHYLGTLAGVRGFSDRFPIPVGDRGEAPRPVWVQRLKNGVSSASLSPYHLDTEAVFDIMRMEGTPHGWTDSQDAWDHGRMNAWPEHKTHRAMGYFKRQDIAYQFALAEAFTICDAYHCSIMSSTNPNRMFLWTGTNDPHGRHGGPVVDNSHDSFPQTGYAEPAYSITSYAQRLQKAGIDWRIYKDMDDFFTNNPLVGIDAYRASYDKKAGSDPELAKRALSTYSLDRLRADVMDGSLPQVSYLIAPARGSEHPGRSSPAQGADYIASVLDTLTSNPETWSKTAFFVMFDENDGFFDHVPPPAPPSFDPADGTTLLGASTVDLSGEYHMRPGTGGDATKNPRLLGRPYGLGSRVPMFVISPWSRGGVVNSQVFDHTSVIRFLETRFGVKEPNISPWRRAVCGDLTSAFNFKTPNAAPFPTDLPQIRARAALVDKIERRIDPLPPEHNPKAVQEAGVRPSSPLPYHLEVRPAVNPSANSIRLNFHNEGKAAAVFHVYDRLNLDRPPCRFTLSAGSKLQHDWPLAGSDGRFDLWILGPNGFHRHFIGGATNAALINQLFWHYQGDVFTLDAAKAMKVSIPHYNLPHERQAKGKLVRHNLNLGGSAGWYELHLSHAEHPQFSIRLAGRAENGQMRTTDTAQ